MKKKNFLWAALAAGVVFAISVVVYNFFDNKDEEKNNYLSAIKDEEKNNYLSAISADYLSAIPADMLFTAKINVGGLLSKSQALEDSFINECLDMLTYDMSGELQSLVKSIIKNPSECGIDVNKDIFFAFKDLESEDFLVTMAVGDVEKLKDAIAVLYKEVGSDDEVKEKDDMYCIEIDNDVSVVAFNEYKLVIAENATDYMTLNDEEQAVSQEEFSNWASRKSDISIKMDVEKLIKDANRNLREEEKTPYNTILNDANVIVDLVAENGSLKCSFEITGNEKLNKLCKEFYSKPKGEHFKCIPNDVLAALVINLNNVDRMKSIYEEYGLLTEKDAKFFNEIFTDEVMKYLATLKGDFTLAVLPFEEISDQKLPQIVGFLSVDGRELFDMIVGVIGNIGATQVEEDVYALGLNKVYSDSYNEYTSYARGYDYYIGYKNNTIFIMPENVYAMNRAGSLSDNFSKNEMAKVLNNNGLVFNVPAIYNELWNVRENMFFNEDLKLFESLKKYSNVIKYLSFKTEAQNRFEIKVDFTKKNVNSLKQILDMVVGFINDQGLMYM